MYFGCHDGVKCAHSEVLIEGNFVHTVDASPGAVGYGIQVKLNTVATIRDNVIVGTKGPGIMVYGARDATKHSVVERNFIAGSRTSSAIVVGGGPAVIRNNVAIESAQAGIGLEDYGGRGLLRRIDVVHNTIYDNAAGGILVTAEPVATISIQNNAVHARRGTPALPAGPAGIRKSGNVDCTALACFADPSRRDFSPLARRPGRTRRGPFTPIDDFFGQRRGPHPVVGAIEAAAGPIQLEMKDPLPE
jgi:hypothetical protein